MNLDEAIEIKEHPPKTRYTWDIQRINEADRLSIEALKRCRNFRDNSQTFGYDPLPGETED